MDIDSLTSLVLSTSAPGRILHVGCGDGALVRHLLRLGVDACGVDESEADVARGRALALDRFQVALPTRLPYEAQAFETIVWDATRAGPAEETLPAILAELRRVTKRFVYICARLRDDAGGPAPDRRDRAWWETGCFRAGFRKHPAYYRANPYEALERADPEIIVPLERIPDQAFERYPLDASMPERDLHMDMLRQAGRRSDGHVIRYALAAELVRCNDIVLDVACRSGHGSHVLRCTTPAARILGLDLSPAATEYARANFVQGSPGLEFRTGDAEDLSFLAAHSIDVVVSFETLEHLQRPEHFLAEVRRILRPGGRIIVSAPNEWRDESGHDPNPRHLHVYNWAKLRAALEPQFLLERAYQQIAGGRIVLRDRPRRLREVPLDRPPDVESEWWIMVGMVSPLDAGSVPYREVFYSYSAPPEHLLAFARDYENPWLVRTMVEYPTRALSRNNLAHFAADVAQQSTPGSADRGAALCVLGYRVLEDAAAAAAEINKLLAGLRDYLTHQPANAHQLRWNISLAFLQAQLLLKLGRLPEAEQAFAACAALDCRPFSPTLGTKTVLAAFLSGRLAHARGDSPQARQRWQAGIAEARRLLEGDWTEFVGNPEDPLPFPLVTAVEFLDCAVMCANGLRATAPSRQPPDTRFWSDVHTCWKTMIDERWKAMQHMEGLIRERDQTIVHQARLVEERRATLQQMEAMLSERWKAVQHMEGLIRERDQTIGDQKALVDQRWAALQQMEGLIKEARASAASAERLALERYEAIQNQSRMIDERDATIRGLQQQLTDEEAAMRQFAEDATRLRQQIESVDKRLAGVENLVRQYGIVWARTHRLHRRVGRLIRPWRWFRREP